MAMKMEEIEALLNAATPGPWTYEQNGKRGAWIGNNGNWSALSCGGTDEEAANNARFIAAAPTIIRELVERVRRLEKQIPCPTCGRIGDPACWTVGCPD